MLDQSGRAFDVGHQHRDEAGRKGDPTRPLDERALVLELAGDETDRHDLELLRRVEQPHARLLAGRLVFEGNLPEPNERVSDV